MCGNGLDDDGDDQLDCADADCGVASCNDGNPCTIDFCRLSDGSCEHTPVAAGTTCGTGCMCNAAGEPVEIVCGDSTDNDGDQLVDCMDPDCAECQGATVCCPDGACRTFCG